MDSQVLHTVCMVQSFLVRLQGKFEIEIDHPQEWNGLTCDHSPQCPLGVPILSKGTLHACFDPLIVKCNPIWLSEKSMIVLTFVGFAIITWIGARCHGDRTFRSTPYSCTQCSRWGQPLPCCLRVVELYRHCSRCRSPWRRLECLSSGKPDTNKKQVMWHRGDISTGFNNKERKPEKTKPSHQL